MLLAGSGRAADFFFLQMSDPQFGMNTADGEFSQETANFEFAIANANRLHPAFVVVCGDLINKPADPAQTAEYLRIASQARPSPSSFTACPAITTSAMSRRPNRWRRTGSKFGRDYYSFRYQDFGGHRDRFELDPTSREGARGSGAAGALDRLLNWKS